MFLYRLATLWNRAGDSVIMCTESIGEIRLRANCNDKKIMKCMIYVLNDLLQMKVHIWNDQ